MELIAGFVLDLTDNQMNVLRAAALGRVIRDGSRDMWGNRRVTDNVNVLARAGYLARPAGSSRWAVTSAGRTVLHRAAKGLTETEHGKARAA